MRKNFLFRKSYLYFSLVVNIDLAFSHYPLPWDIEYETLIPGDISSSNTTVQGEGHTEQRVILVAFKAFHKRYSLRLSPLGSILHPHVSATLIGADGTETQLPVKRDKIFSGTVVGDRFRRVSAAEVGGVWIIHIRSSSALLSVEPLRWYDPMADQKLMVVYKGWSVWGKEAFLNIRNQMKTDPGKYEAGVDVGSDESEHIREDFEGPFLDQPATRRPIADLVEMNNSTSTSIQNSLFNIESDSKSTLVRSSGPSELNGNQTNVFLSSKPTDFSGVNLVESSGGGRTGLDHDGGIREDLTNTNRSWNSTPAGKQVHDFESLRLGERPTLAPFNLSDYRTPVTPTLNRLRRSPISTSAHNLSTECDLLAIADYNFYTLFDSNVQMIISALTLIYNYADGVFRRARFQGHPTCGIIVKEFRIFSGYSNSPMHYNSQSMDNLDADELLKAMRESPGSEYFYSFCMVHLNCVRHFRPEVVGLAYWAEPIPDYWTAGICGVYFNKSKVPTPSNVMLTKPATSLGIDLIEYSLVVVHELGHAWGSQHDPDSGQCVQRGDSNIMDRYTLAKHTVDRVTFSACSHREIENLLERRSGCFLSPAQLHRICGNNALDDGEECDPGYGEPGSHPCCDDGCRLRETAQCSFSHNPCCSENCTLQEAGSLQREDRKRCRSTSSSESSECSGVKCKSIPHNKGPPVGFISPAVTDVSVTHSNDTEALRVSAKRATHENSIHSVNRALPSPWSRTPSGVQYLVAVLITQLHDYCVR